MSATKTLPQINNFSYNKNTKVYRYANTNMQAWKYDNEHHNMDDSTLHTSSSNASALPAAAQLIKSNSYSGAVMDYKLDTPTTAKCRGLDLDTNSNSETIKINSNSATSISVANSSAANSSAADTVNINEDVSEYDTFLINNGGSSTSNGNNNNNNSTRRNARPFLLSSKSRNSCWMRTHAFITRNWYLSYLVPACILVALLAVAYLTRDYAKQLLFWIETQNEWLIFIIFMGLFTLVSFPIVVGYFVLLITAGYLFGCWKGWFTVILGANVGIAVAHAIIRSFRHRIPLQKLIKNETGRAILRVISGPKAFKVVLFTRLTPIPFGLQNVIFGISAINPRDYHVATFLGLLPAQTINVYLGSTLRSMQEVLNDNDAKLTGYISFVIEVICGVGLMYWVVQKARKELSDTLLTDYNGEGKHVDVQV